MIDNNLENIWDEVTVKVNTKIKRSECQCVTWDRENPLNQIMIFLKSVLLNLSFTEKFCAILFFKYLQLFQSYSHISNNTHFCVGFK